MSGFDDVTLEWAGESYRIPAERVLPLICRVEDALCLDPDDTSVEVLLRKPRPARLASAFEAALRHAGAPVGPGEVYLAIMEHLADGNPDHLVRTQEIVLALLALIAPPIHRQIREAAATGKKPPAVSSASSTG